VRGKNSFNKIEKLTPILLILVIGMAFAVGVLWQKVSVLEEGGVSGNGAIGTGSAAPAFKKEPADGKLSDEVAKKVPQVNAINEKLESSESLSDHVRGNKDAKVKLIEYSDYYCPFCKRFHPTAKRVLEEYGDRVAWVYRHFPLDTLHPNARAVAEISECVAFIGGESKFWEFTDKIYDELPEGVEGAFNIASGLGLDRTDVEGCYNEGKFKERVNRMYQGGVDAGITGTPGNIVINDKGDSWLVPGAVPFENLKTILDQAL